MKKVFILALSALFCAVTLSAQNQDLPDNDWAQFNRYSKANSEVTVKPLAVLMGDSITDGWLRQDPEFFKANNLAGRGISGQVTSHMLMRFRRDVIDLHPKYVVILAGINDIARNNGYISLEKILAQRGIGIKNGIKLLLVCHTDVIRMDHRMSFAHLRAIIEYIHLGTRLV